MKIIAGERKGHNLITPKGKQTRPTLARVKESLFSIIAGDIPGSTFCDLFAGTGAIGFEALSRGAEKAILVESAQEALNCLRSNAEKLHYRDQALIIENDALRWNITSSPHPPDIIFADPPYQPEIISRLVNHLEAANLPPDALVIVQTPASYVPQTKKLRHLRSEKYGATALHFYLSISKADSGN